MTKKPKGYWTFEKCLEEALKHNLISEWEKNCNASYVAATKNKWLPECTKHMERKCKPANYWTFEKCLEEAIKYTTRSEFQKNNKSCYVSARKNKWLNLICNHMTSPQKPSGYWNYNNCKEVALLCKSRSELQKKFKGAYVSSFKNKWIDEICSHMKPIGHRYKRMIYAYEFPDNSVYVGLTCSENDRRIAHANEGSSSVFKYIKETNLEPIYKVLSGYVSVEESIKLEGFFVENYRNEGWEILNKIKTGHLGSNKIRWSKEECRKSALICKTKKEFKKKFSRAYNVSLKRKWIDEIGSHFICLKKPKHYWTFERCKEEASKYNSRKEFCKNSGGAYYKSRVNGWLNLICTHMIQK